MANNSKSEKKIQIEKFKMSSSSRSTRYGSSSSSSRRQRFSSRRREEEDGRGEKKKTLLDISNRFKETAPSVPPTTPTRTRVKKSAQTPGAALMSALNELNLSTSKIVSSVSRVGNQRKKTQEDR